MEHIKHLSLGWLVMAAALLFAGCSGEDGVIEEQTTEPTAQTQATIHVTVGAGITDGEATTRSTVDYTGGTRTLQFTTGDKLYVCGKASRSSYASGYEYYGYVLAGMLALDAIDPDDPTKATFSGDLSVYEALVDGDYDDGTGDWNVIYGVTYPDANRLDYLPYFISSDDPLSSCDYVRATLIHEGTESQVTIDDYKDISLPTYDCAATVEELMTTGLIVTGNYYAGTKSFALTKDTDQPIVNCTISGLEAGVSYKVDYIYGTTAAMSDHTKALFSSLTATAGTLAFAFIAETGDKFHGIRLTNAADAGDTYVIDLGNRQFAANVYNVSRIWDGTMMRREVDLTKKNANYTAENGDILIGTMPTGNRVFIASGATVTLRNVTVTRGINCNGSAIIELEGANSVSGGGGYCGVYIESGTLTIQGSGSLSATGIDDNPGIGGYYSSANLVITGGTITAQGGDDGAAGIGSGSKNTDFGTITITGGTVTATGGNCEFGGGAGIGCGREGSTCGNITITGGTVTATGGKYAAGIGSQDSGTTCGDITIGGSVTVTATKGAEAAFCIGAGHSGTCGDVTVNYIYLYDSGEAGDTRYIYPYPYE